MTRAGNTDETVATFEHNGDTYEIDHLGICNPGTFVVYRNGHSVGHFCHYAPWGNSHDIPLSDEIDLVALAKAAIA